LLVIARYSKGSEVAENLCSIICSQSAQEVRIYVILLTGVSKKRTLIGLIVVGCALMGASQCQVFTPVFVVVS
jgi:hypothetical protein